MKKILTVLAAAGLMLSSGAALAQSNDAFAGIDTDDNGKVSWGEFSLVIDYVDQQAFDLADADGDGFLTEDEWGALEIQTGGIAGPADPVEQQLVPQSLIEQPVN
jgi:Ca2+-binding EF-hand superfamily protein